MSANSSIEWCDHTFNPWIGCTKVSTTCGGGGGCDNCYAEVSTPARSMRILWGAGAPRHRTAPSTWAQPTTWNKHHAEFFAEHGRRQRVFCASLADVFDNEVDPAWRAELFALIASTPNLDWLLLTKRIGNVAKMIEAPGMQKAWPAHARLGITAVNQQEWDRDIGKLLRLDVPNFVSLEPLLGKIDMRLGGAAAPDYAEHRPLQRRPEWVICGGESGSGARPMHPDWARSLRDQCAAAGVPFLFKQWGEWVAADDDCGTVVPVTEIVGDVPWQEGKRVRVQWLSPNGGIVGHTFARLGKKAAGRLLDGVEHNGFPA